MDTILEKNDILEVPRAQVFNWKLGRVDVVK